MTYPPVDPAPPPPEWPAPRVAPVPGDQPLVHDANIQGNILAGFNKDHQVLLFIALPNADAGRAWLNELLPRIATNAAVADFNSRFSTQRRAGGGDPQDLTAVWTNVSFTASGLTLLDSASTSALTASGAPDPSVQLWLGGTASAELATAVGDKTTAGWLFGTGTPDIHALVCLAADRPQDLELEVTKHRESAARLGITIVFEQAGETLPGTSAGHEHFGFKDGISQPGVSGFDPPNPNKPEEVAGKAGTDLIAAGTFVLGYPRDDSNHVPVPAWMFDGSFLVTRRLAQNVPGFWEGVTEQHAANLSGSEVTDPNTGISNPDALAARLVGRWRSGTPTDHAPVSDNRSAQDPAQDNNFDFSDDAPGDRTPACAHIRKVYPRQGATTAATPVTENETKIHRILRRGIPFGQPFDPTAGRGAGLDAERGLVFQCYQASLADQFVFLQQAWVNNPNFPDPGTGNDPVIGTASTVSIRAGGQVASLTFADFVRTEGSLFTLTPSLKAIAALSTGTPLSSIPIP